MKIFIISLLLSGVLLAQVRHDYIRIGTGGTLDAGSAGRTAPIKVGTTLPATCTVGDLYYKTDATAGQNLYSCTATNTWTQHTGGSGGGLGDPGSNGVVKRTSLNTTTTATAGTDYSAPGTNETTSANRTQTGVWDASGATSTKPAKAGTSLPATCAVGELYFKTDATGTAVLYACTSLNTWTQQTGTGGGGVADPGSSAFMVRTALNVTTARTLQAGTGLSITNPTGVGGDPTFSIDAAYHSMLTGSASIDFASVPAGGCSAASTISVVGAATGDYVAPGWPSGLSALANGRMWVSAADTVSVVICNMTGDAYDAAALTFKAGVIK